VVSQKSGIKVLLLQPQGNSKQAHESCCYVFTLCVALQHLRLQLRHSSGPWVSRKKHAAQVVAVKGVLLLRGCKLRSAAEAL
jgi:hypothetical protein